MWRGRRLTEPVRLRFQQSGLSRFCSSARALAWTVNTRRSSLRIFFHFSPSRTLMALKHKKPSQAVRSEDHGSECFYLRHLYLRGGKCGCSTAAWPTGAEYPNAKLQLQVNCCCCPTPDSTHLLSFPGCICVYSTLNFLANNMKAFIGRLHFEDALSPFAGPVFCFLFGFWREGGEPL